MFWFLLESYFIYSRTAVHLVMYVILGLLGLGAGAGASQNPVSATADFVAVRDPAVDASGRWVAGGSVWYNIKEYKNNLIEYSTV